MAYPDYQIGIKRIDEITSCPHCGSTDVRETRKFQKHCNGHWNESIEFSCGARYQFTPNYMRVGIHSACLRDPKFKERQKLTEKVKLEIFELAKKRGVHEDEQASLERALEYWKPSGW